jgi:hypothetical protein
MSKKNDEIFYVLKTVRKLYPLYTIRTKLNFVERKACDEY